MSVQNYSSYLYIFIKHQKYLDGKFLKLTLEILRYSNFIFLFQSIHFSYYSKKLIATRNRHYHCCWAISAIE